VKLKGTKCGVTEKNSSPSKGTLRKGTWVKKVTKDCKWKNLKEYFFDNFALTKHSRACDWKWGKGGR